VIHFTEAKKTLAEMRRILKHGGLLIIANLDLRALSGLNRARCIIQVVYHGLVGHRVKPPKGFGKNMMTEKELSDLLNHPGSG
jgi:ubiquinone/menaquinone biosynthesis C-methylase UbiE